MTRPRFPRHVYTLALALPLLLGACTDAAESVPPATSAPAVASAVSSAQAAFLDSRIAELEARHSTRIGVTAVDPTTGAVYRHRGAERFALCSTFKTYAAAEVLRRTSEGTSSLDKAVPVEASALVENSPVTAAAVGTSMTLAELAEAALTRSDNTAGNLLLTEIGGPQAITALARSIGDDTTRLDRWETELNTAVRGDPRDTSTTDGLAEGYRALLLGDELEPTHRRQLLDWLRASTTSDTRIRAGLPPGWSAADKTGTGRFGTANDAGVVWDREGNPLVLVILTDSSTNQEAAQPNSDAIAETTTAVIGALDAP